MDFFIKKRMTFLAVFIFSSLWGMCGKALSADNWTYPQDQVWKVISGGPVPGVKVPADLAGIPFILKGARFYLMANTLAMPSPNMAGAYSVTPGCFSSSGPSLTFHPLEDRQGKSSYTFEIVSKSQLKLVLDGFFEFQLEERPLDAQAEEDLHGIRDAYNRKLEESWNIRKAIPAMTIKGCKVSPITIKYQPVEMPLRVSFPGKSINKTFSSHSIDPFTNIQSDSSRTIFLERYHGPERIVRGCRATLLLRNAHLSHGVYIVHGVSGQTMEGDNMCNRSERVWLFDSVILRELIPGNNPQNWSYRETNRPSSKTDYYFEVMTDGPGSKKGEWERLFYVLKLGALDTDTPSLELIETRLH